MAADRMRTLCACPVALLMPLLLLTTWAAMVTQMQGSSRRFDAEHMTHESSMQQSSTAATTMRLSSTGGSNRRMRGSSRSSSSSIGGSSRTVSSSGSSDMVTIKAPKVALLILARDGSALPNEPVWRAFFETAAQLQLQPAAATAATVAAERGAASSVQDLLGSRPLHPALEKQKPSSYPGYKIQHGLTRGAKPRWPRISLSQNIGGPRSSYSSSSQQAWLNFSAHSLPRERLFLQQEMQRLLQLAPQQAPTSVVADHPKQQQLKRNANAFVRDSMKQLNTVEQVAALEGQLGFSASSLSSIEAQDLGLRRGLRQPQQDVESSSGSTNSIRGPIQPVLAQQQLFSVYVHSPDGLLLPADSIFSGSELRVRLNTTQGYAQHVLAEAAVLLLQAALQDESNVHFVMVSDTSIPLYPPQVVWAQMMSEQRSRLDACKYTGNDLDLYRWSAALSSDYFGKQHWRKSSQWFTLTRPAALLAVADSHVRELFRRHCYTNFTALIGRSMCVSDEHYLPSLMASYGLDDATDCKGRASYADWSPGGWHPKTFTATDITPELVPRMRGGGHAARVQPTEGLPGYWAAAAAVAAETAEAAAAAQALRGTLATDEAEVAAARAAAVALRVQEAAEEGSNGPGAPCDVAAAMYTASAIIFQPQDAAVGVISIANDRAAAAVGGVGIANDGAAAAAAAAAATAAAAMSSGRSEQSVVRYRLSAQMAWLTQKGRQLDSEHDSSSSSSLGDGAGRKAASMRPTSSDSDDDGFALWRHGASRWIVNEGYVPLASHCPLFARKFTASVTNETLTMALSCAGLGLGSWCSNAQWLAGSR